MDIKAICTPLKKASLLLATHTTQQKNTALLCVKDSILKHTPFILEQNQKDLLQAQKKGMSPALQERLALNKGKMQDILKSLDIVISLSDPVGQETGWQTAKGLCIRQKRVPLGVVAIIYESRPNVTIDAFSLAYKSANSILLRGSSSAIYSNTAIEKAIICGLEQAGENAVPSAIHLVKGTSHSDVDEILSATGLIDVVLPRGGQTLIKTVVEKAKVPVIQTGSGVCHLYVDKTADIDMAVNIAVNAKMQRPGACNAIECIIVHKDIAKEFLKKLEVAFCGKVLLKADDKALQYLSTNAQKALECDFGKEFLDFVVAIKTIDSLKKAVEFINEHNTQHSDAIITKDYTRAKYFQDMVDSACVYVNASTRFSDGGEFGFGCELGISTQKLHARGPMGLLALTTTKYLIEGTGQVR